MGLEQYLPPYWSTASICFDCRRACGGCPWSAGFRPVPGWRAQPSRIHEGGFRVTACPLFLRDPVRDSPRGEATAEQIKVMLEHWRRDGENI